MSTLITEELMYKLATAYATNPESNIYKLFSLAANRYQEHQDALTLIRNWKDIDQAEGTTLDVIGHDVGQARGGMDDATYRMYIKIRIRSNLSKGDIETLNEIARLLLGDGFDGIIEGNMINSYLPSIPDQEAAIFYVLNGDKLNTQVPTSELAQLTAGGVRSNFEILYRPDIIIDVEYRGGERPPQKFIRAGQMVASGATFTTGGRFY